MNKHRMPSKTVMRNVGVSTPSEFRQLKRAQVNEALRHLNKARFAAMWSPAWPEIDQARKLLEKAREKQSRKNWGR